MGDSDAEWVGVDFEFGTPSPRTTRRPPTGRPRTQRPPRIFPPATEPPHDAAERKPNPGPAGNSDTSAIVYGLVGGVLGLVLLLLVIYMLVLRRRLNKAKNASTDSQYQLRVEDVAHLTNLDETSNTYVNTTDLQKLMSSVRAKNKSENRLPTMPKIQHQTPAPYRPAVPDPQSNESRGHADNNGFNTDPDVVVVRAPMPLPHNNISAFDNCDLQSSQKPPVHETQAIYSNLEPSEPFVLSEPPSRKKVEAPRIAPPPPPTKLKNRTVSHDGTEAKEAPLSPTAIARPAPPPPKLMKTKSSDALVAPPSQKSTLPGASKPIPPVAPKPNKGAQPSTSAVLPNAAENKPSPPTAFKPTPSRPAPVTVPKPTPPSSSKPTPPVAAKPGVLHKGKGLPPLKMALLPSLSRGSLDNCSTPDTGIIELTPDSTPTPGSDNSVATGSIGSKIAFLERKMNTPVLPSRAMPPKTNT